MKKIIITAIAFLAFSAGDAMAQNGGSAKGNVTATVSPYVICSDNECTLSEDNVYVQITIDENGIAYDY